MRRRIGTYPTSRLQHIEEVTSHIRGSNKHGRSSCGLRDTPVTQPYEASIVVGQKYTKLQPCALFFLSLLSEHHYDAFRPGESLLRYPLKTVFTMSHIADQKIQYQSSL